MRYLRMLVAALTAPHHKLCRNAAATECCIPNAQARQELALRALAQQDEAVATAAALSARIESLSGEEVLARFMCKVHLLNEVKNACDRIVRIDQLCGGLVLADLRPAVELVHKAMSGLEARSRDAHRSLTAACAAITAVESFVGQMQNLHLPTAESISERS